MLPVLGAAGASGSVDRSEARLQGSPDRAEPRWRGADVRAGGGRVRTTLRRRAVQGETLPAGARRVGADRAGVCRQQLGGAPRGCPARSTVTGPGGQPPREDPGSPVGAGSAHAPCSANPAPSWPDEDITPTAGAGGISGPHRGRQTDTEIPRLPPPPWRLARQSALWLPQSPTGAAPTLSQERNVPETIAARGLGDGPAQAPPAANRERRRRWGRPPVCWSCRA